MLGDIQRASALAADGMRLADETQDFVACVAARTIAALCAHYRYDVTESERLFAEAQSIWAGAFPAAPVFSSLSGLRRWGDRLNDRSGRPWPAGFARLIPRDQAVPCR